MDDIKIQDLTVIEFRFLMQEILRKHERDRQYAKYNGLYPDQIPIPLNTYGSLK